MLAKETTHRAVTRVANAVGANTTSDRFKERCRYLHDEFIERDIDDPTLLAAARRLAETCERMPALADWLGACTADRRARPTTSDEPPPPERAKVTCPGCGEHDDVWTNTEPPRAAMYHCRRCHTLFAAPTDAMFAHYADARQRTRRLHELEEA